MEDLLEFQKQRIVALEAQVDFLEMCANHATEMENKCNEENDKLREELNALYNQLNERCEEK